MRLLFSLIAATGLSVAMTQPAVAASPDCAVEGGTLLSWPAGEPIWEMCWLGPNSSAGPRGSGMELRAVHHNGFLVAKRIHSPMLFAEYTSGTCYRDWKDDATATLAHSTTHNQIAVPPDLDRLATTACSVSTTPTQAFGTCPFQQPTGGGFSCTSGEDVVIEDLGDHVRLVAQYRADWYMYDSRISFFDDGAIEPVFGFGNNNGTLNNTTHWHHNYWRFDFDIDGADDNMVSINDVDQAVEFDDVRGPVGSTTWEVRNTVTDRGYRLVPGADDYNVATNESGRGFHLVDLMATRYIANEYGDNPNYSLGDCGMNEDALVNGASIENEDVVLWYRVAVRDSTANDWPPGCGGGGTPCIPQDSMVCKTAGPRIEPFGPWGGVPQDEADLGIALAGSETVAQPGMELFFDITVDNAGDQVVDEAEVTVELPDGFRFLNGTGIGDAQWSCVESAETVTCQLESGSIGVDAEVVLQIDVLVDLDVISGPAETLVTIESAQWPDPVDTNNSATTTTTIEGGLIDPIFPNGFECTGGLPGCN